MRRSVVVVVLALLCSVGCTSRLYDVKTDKTLFLETLPGQKIYLKVTNTSLLTDFPLAQDVAARLKAKSYVLVDRPDKADVVLRANVLYSGLIEPAVKGDKALGGAVAGGVAGGLGGYALGGRKGATAGGALAGMLVGAGLGYWLEKRDMKNTFITTVDLKIEEKARKKVHTVHIHARIRDKDLTMESAAERVRPDIAAQVAGHF